MEDSINNIQGNCRSNGESVERIRIVFASDLQECDCCGEPWCAIHMEHFADCGCLGISNAEDEGYTIKEEDGILWAIVAD